MNTLKEIIRVKDLEKQTKMLSTESDCLMAEGNLLGRYGMTCPVVDRKPLLKRMDEITQRMKDIAMLMDVLKVEAKDEMAKIKKETE